jgi:hypothetical protein
MEEDQLYIEAKKIVRKKKGFYMHFCVYLAVNIVLFLILFFEEGTFEWLIPASFWGIGLFIHYTVIFGFPGKKGLGGSEWEQREIEKEMQKLGADENFDFSKPTEVEELELKEMKPIRKNKWNDSDLV